jgi:hypothetical protein
MKLNESSIITEIKKESVITDRIGKTNLLHSIENWGFCYGSLGLWNRDSPRLHSRSLRHHALW